MHMFLLWITSTTFEPYYYNLLSTQTPLYPKRPVKIKVSLREYYAAPFVSRVHGAH